MATRQTMRDADEFERLMNKPRTQEDEARFVALREKLMGVCANLSPAEEGAAMMRAEARVS